MAVSGCAEICLDVAEQGDDAVWLDILRCVEGNDCRQNTNGCLYLQDDASAEHIADLQIMRCAGNDSADEQ